MSNVLSLAIGTQAACKACIPRYCQQQQAAAVSYSRRRSRFNRRCVARSRPEDEIEPVPPAMLSRLDSEDELEQEAGWLSSMIECWANEEWAAQELLGVHAEMGAATGQAYLQLRRQEGVQEMGDLVLGLATELMTSYDFHPTFTSAFDVSNKVVELLMLRDGCDVCCTSESDRTAISRFEAQLDSQRQG